MRGPCPCHEAEERHWPDAKVKMVICTRLQSASDFLECQRITAIYRLGGEALRLPGTRQGYDVVVFIFRRPPD